MYYVLNTRMLVSRDAVCLNLLHLHHGRISDDECYYYTGVGDISTTNSYVVVWLTQKCL